MLPETLPLCTEQLSKQGARRLWVLSGSDAWCEETLHAIMAAVSGDWPVISSCLPGGVGAAQARLLLGREFCHGVFDARRGLHTEALAMLTGTLQAGSWLILLLPAESEWLTRPDEDSLRWNDRGQLIAAPRFMRHLAQTLNDEAVVCWHEGQSCQLSLLPQRARWLPLKRGRI